MSREFGVWVWYTMLVSSLYIFHQKSYLLIQHDNPANQNYVMVLLP